ncbi:MAG: ribose-phosphate diphosphokinase [Nanoarchaeota archaeon]|nr:ribose-phosphate diphosphokinase [Nanoarchaeota archaeon]
MKYILTDSVKHLNIPSVKIKKTFFPEGELNLIIEENLKNKPVTIISNVTTDNILEFLFTIDAAKRMGAKIKEIIIPFMSYARQDQLYVKGGSISGAVICSILKSLDIPIITLDIHSLRLKRYLKFKNISLLTMFLEDIPLKKYVIVSPDLGGAQRARKIARILRAPLVIIKKTRKDHIEMKLDKKLPRKNVLIVEDMISTGTTLVKTAKLLKQKGAKEIYCISTHGLFVKGARQKLLKSGIKKIFVTNTLLVKPSRQIGVKKIEEILELL